jgi:hypothetical protein
MESSALHAYLATEAGTPARRQGEAMNEIKRWFSQAAGGLALVLAAAAAPSVVCAQEVAPGLG